MSTEILILVVCICCFCSSILACALIYPPPAETPSSIPKFKKVASGRVVYDPDKTILNNNSEEQCGYNCEIDWTCKGFHSWAVKDKFGFTSGKCVKHTSNINPWMTLPGYLVGKPTSNIYVKIS